MNDVELETGWVVSLSRFNSKGVCYRTKKQKQRRMEKPPSPRG